MGAWLPLLLRENIANPPLLHPHEPENTAEAIKGRGLGHVVLTGVDRDGSLPFSTLTRVLNARPNLPEGVAAYFSETIVKINQK
jgi:lipoate synthase